MADKFDPYREALVVETDTVWSAECESLTAEEKASIEAAIHQAPESCSQLEYIRQHTGFCRRITVTLDDVRRLGH